ncbi:hypothetical protein O181_029914 [Austropuccinia psidii MF-1]|uniref:DUF4939 domain-containing protein n=1 Tax=Austropuccinia psidii MF-1 TaxID=1389203 RepID=A0A9Q3CRT6_9BASI|nr:hypothetical protein [Austropuccinia psidii MF-1]
MPLQHSPPARKTRSQAQTQAVLTPTPRAPLDGTPAVSQLRARLDRGPILEGAAPSRKEGRVPRRSNFLSRVVGGFPGMSRTTFRGPGEDGEEGEENSVEEEESDGTEASPSPGGASEGTRGPTLAQSDQPGSHQTKPSLLAIMQQMTQIMANLQAASSSEVSRQPAFKTPSMKAPERFDRTQPFKVRSLIQSCQLIFHNDLENFSQDRKKALYATSFLIGRAAKWIEPYFSNLNNQDSSYLLNSWPMFEYQLFTLFGDPNEVRKAEAELDGLRLKEGDMFPYTLPVSGVWFQELEIGVKGLLFIISARRQGLIPFHSDHKDYYDPSKPFSNDFSSAKSCAALVGDFRTPSFPSYAHIPSLNSHQSLLSSIDELFKEIQNVGEDNSVSSLHLFFGNMDLPTSSYHDSLQELWDKEEEPEETETLMKVFPSTYHQYFDLFSKVKAEKLSPHRACDNHIELAGSPPPFGVIYSLSNQESDTLRAYISENIEKVFIRPSFSSTGAPVLFIKRNDGGLHLCVGYHKLNAVTRKNKYPVPPMNQLLTYFNCSSIFSKSDLHGAYNIPRIKEGT